MVKVARKVIGRGRSWLETRNSRRSAQRFPILPANTGEVLALLQAGGCQSVFLPAIFGLCPPNRIETWQDAIMLRLFCSAGIFADGDLILMDSGAVWDKVHRPQIANSIPKDGHLFAFDQDSVLFDPRRRQHQVAAGLSLCGVHGSVWSHFLVQYLPKLAALPQILERLVGDLTLITPRYDDPQIEEIVAGHVSRYDRVRRLSIGWDESVVCEQLFHVPHTAYIADHANQLTVYDLVLSDFAAATLRREFHAPVGKPLEAGYERIYLMRRGHRKLSNTQEVEDFFTTRGFTIVDPAELTLAAKLALFRRASFVTGPLSSAFANLIFSSPGTKALVMAGFARSFDAYVGMLGPRFGIDVLFVSGGDLATGIHADFHIPLEQIEQAYEALMNTPSGAGPMKSLSAL